MKTIRPPQWMLAELTYKCPLSCPYCSNPVDLSTRKQTLNTRTWVHNIKGAAQLGVTQIGFSGGEPLLRKDLEEFVCAASNEDIYTNLITSSVGLTRTRIDMLKDSGLNSIQVSFQADTPDLNNYIAKNDVYYQKVEAAKVIKDSGFPLTFNIVLHRQNSDRSEQILDFAINMLGADYIELANTQFYGWAFRNREALLPTRAQVEYTQAVTDRYIEKYKSKCKIFYILSDYYEGRPKPCMGGWANDFFVINPEGYMLPCHSAMVIPDLDFESCKIDDDKLLDLGDIWYNSEVFNKYRGNSWMKEPCRSCDERFVDFGGCRCQAYMLTGDATGTDPVCNKSPKYQELIDTIQSFESSEFEYRD